MEGRQTRVPNYFVFSPRKLKVLYEYFIHFLGLSYNKASQIGGLTQQIILPQLWRQEVQNQGVTKTMPPLKALGKNSFLTLSSFWWCQHPWCLLVCICMLQSLPPSSYVLLPCVCLHIPSLLLAFSNDTSH